jgi:bisanhydrobacterioruberin hydratase
MKALLAAIFLFASLGVGTVFSYRLGIADAHPQVSLWMSVMLLLVLAAPAVSSAFQALPGFKVVGILLLLSGAAYVFEITSVLTGVPYGLFLYGAEMGPKLGGIVPYTVPLAWVPLLIAVDAALPKRVEGLYRVVAGALLLVFYDLVLDPSAVALGFWQWDKGEGALYYGVPLSNFFGWFLTGLIGMFLWLRVTQGQVIPARALLTLLLSTSVWTGSTLALGFVVPACVGVLMLIFFVKQYRYDVS